MPSWTSPSRVPTAGMPSISPKVSSHVVETFRPILCSTFVAKTPLRSPSSPVSGSKWNFGTRNSERPLVPTPAPSGPGQDEVHDVVHEVVLAGGDEPLDAGDVPGAVGLLDGLGPTGADVRAGVRLGQHHRAAPVLVDHDLGELQLLGRAVAEDGVGEGVAAGVHVHGRVGAEDELLDGPAQRRRYDRAAELLRQVHPPPLGVDVGLVAALERLGHPHRVRRRVVDRRVAVTVDERRGQLVLGQPGDLAEHLAGDVLVHLGVRRGAEHVLAAEHLEQGELDVSQVAPVVAHGQCPSRASDRCRRRPTAALLVSNMMLLTSNKRNRVSRFGPTG